MRCHSIPICLTLLALMTAAPTLAAEATVPGQGTVDIRFLDEPIRDLDEYADHLSRSTTTGSAVSLHSLAGGSGSELAPVAERSSGASDVLLVPYFEVDRRRADGATTMLAIRNETGDDLPVRILFVSAFGATVETSREVTLAPAATKTINLRDVEDLPTGSDGIARGLVVLGAVGVRGQSGAMLSGDFFYVDPATDYATGNTLIDMSLNAPDNELCAAWSTRFFNSEAISGRSSFRFVVDLPSGASPYDPPTAIGTVYDETGRAVRSFEIRTDLSSFRLTSDDLIPDSTSFGSLSIRFAGSDGAVLTEHSGFHRLSVALRGACLDQ